MDDRACISFDFPAIKGALAQAGDALEYLAQMRGNERGRILRSASPAAVAELEHFQQAIESAGRLLNPAGLPSREQSASTVITTQGGSWVSLTRARELLDQLCEQEPNLLLAPGIRTAFPELRERMDAGTLDAKDQKVLALLDTIQQYRHRGADWVRQHLAELFSRNTQTPNVVDIERIPAFFSDYDSLGAEQRRIVLRAWHAVATAQHWLDGAEAFADIGADQIARGLKLAAEAIPNRITKRENSIVDEKPRYMGGRLLEFRGDKIRLTEQEDCAIQALLDCDQFIADQYDFEMLFFIWARSWPILLQWGSERRIWIAGPTQMR